MELKDFVQQTLLQIIRGVSSAQGDPSRGVAMINPTEQMRCGQKLLDNSLYSLGQHLQLVQMVEFDVAVTAEEGKGTKGGVGIMVGTIGLGAQGQSEAKNTTENRIKFQIPLMLPR